MADQQPVNELGHSLEPRHVAMIALGGVIGAGLFIGSSTAIHHGGPGVVVVYAICGLLVILIMRMLGELAMVRPGLGSFAEYAAAGLGPWAGFVIRWLYWYCMIFGIGAETVAGAKLLHEAGMPGPVWAVGLGLILLMTIVNLVSVRTYGELEFWLASLKVAAISLFIAGGVAFILLFGPGPRQALSTMVDHGGLLPRGIGGLLAAIPIVIFSMFGSEIATIAAAESQDPAGNIAKAGRSVALRIVVFYICSVVLITAIVPWNSLVVGLSPFTAALNAIGIPGGGQVMSGIVITAVLSVLNSAIYISSRMLYELGRSGDGPPFLRKTARNRTPWIGVLIGFAAGSAAALGQLFLSQDVFSLLAGSAGSIMLFIYILVVLAQISQRRRMEAQGVPIRLKVWLFPWLSYATICLLAGVLLVLAWMPDQRLMLILSGAPIIAVFAALWLHRGRQGSRTASVTLDRLKPGPPQSGTSRL